MVKSIYNDKISNNKNNIININNDNNDNNDNDNDNIIKVELLEKKINQVSNIHSIFSSSHGFSLINCINTIGQLRQEVLNQMLSNLKTMNDDDATKNILDRLKSDKEMLPPPHLPSSFALLQIISSILLHITFALLLHRSPIIKKMIEYRKLSNSNIMNANAVFITYQSSITNNSILSNYNNEITKKQFIVPLKNVDDEIISYFNKSSSLKNVICNLFPTKNKKLKKQNDSIIIKKFEFQNQPYYIYSSYDSNMFFKGIPSLDFTFSTLLHEITNNKSSSNSLSGGLSNKLANIKHKLYGSNKLITPLPSFWDQMQRRFFTPTEVYQTLSQFFSVLEEPLGYPLFRIFCDNFIKCFEVFRNYYATRFLYEASQKSQFNNTVWICRESNWCQSPVEDIVPGDIIALDKGHVPGDCLILQGNAVVNEASQTGESIPQIRTAIDLISNAASKLSISSHEKHILKSGTEIVQLSKRRKNDLNIKIYMENEKIPILRCLVLRTGSNSFQGSLNSKMKQLDNNEIYGTLLQRKDYFKLLTILYSSAIFASGYVLFRGVQDKSRNMFRLIVQVTRILMSMAPPDLYSSITGSINIGLHGLSVNNNIHCLEPMKLSVAGVVNTCLFDKTGTLTTDKVIINGFTSLTANNINEIPLYALDGSIQASIASCHTLFNLGDSSLTGDPIEIAMFDGLSNKSKSKSGYWSYNSTDKVASIKKKNTLSVYINKTYDFDSDLQRMSAISLVTNTGSSNSNYYQLVSKGSPESIFSCLSQSQQSDANFTSSYFKTYNSLTKNGKRVLALANKKVRTLNLNQMVNKRDYVESNLTFQGFLSFSCPLRNDTKNSITDLHDAKMKLAMITGDALVTACYVASTSGILSNVDKSDYEDNIHDSLGDILVLQLSKNGNSSKLQWVDLEGQIVFKYNESDDYDYDNGQEDGDKDDDDDLNDNDSTSMTALELRRLGNYNLAITGDVVNHLRSHTSLSLDKVMKELTNFKVFARINPNTKTFIVQTFKYNKNIVLMCGDGGNDVGALKAADVGVALLQNEKEDTNKINIDRDSERVSLRIGDASVAAPFTSRYPTVQSVVHILRYGRSTQALILQNYLSTTLDCLLNGYSLSVLYLQGTKFSQQQLLTFTIVAYLVNFGYFMVKPLDRISSNKLPSSVFNYKMIMKVIIYLLIFQSAMTISQNMFNDSIAVNEIVSDYYKPNNMSSIIFLFGLLQIITVPAYTFLGQPYIKDLHEQKKILIPLIASFAFMVVLLFELIPSLNELILFQISTPMIYKKVLLSILLFGSSSLMFIVNHLLK